MHPDIHPGPPVHHFDLYRLSGAADLGRLQLGETFGAALSLIEWAERLGAAVPPERLDLRFFMLPDVRAVQALQTYQGIGTSAKRSSDGPERLRLQGTSLHVCYLLAMRAVPCTTIWSCCSSRWKHTVQPNWNHHHCREA